MRPLITKRPAPLKGDSTFRIYLKRGDDGRQLSFTVKTDSTGGGASDWTNGEPDKFEYKGKDQDKDKVYYYIDTMWLNILPDVLVHFGQESWKRKNDTIHYGDPQNDYSAFDSLFKHDANHIPRYLYKENDDDWRPLYVKLEEVPEVIPSHYVGEKWVKENRYHLSAALQTVIGTSGSVAMGDEATIVDKDNEATARFEFKFADSLSKVTHTFASKKYVYPNSDKAEEFQNTDSIELFHIKYDNKYLTVLDKTEFADASVSDSTVANMQLGWLEPIKSRESARQMFAIVRSDVDSSITLLPVASRKWTRENGQIKYADTLSFNLGIGRHVKLHEDAEKDTTADLKGTWYISHLSKVGSAQKLVVADSLSTIDHLWFKVESPLKPWRGHEEGKIASIKKVTKGKYYRGDEKFIDNVTANDIRAHWRVVKVDSLYDKESDRKVEQKDKAWKFTPVIDRIYGTPQEHGFSRDTVLAYDDGKGIVIMDKEATEVLDTLEVHYNINTEEVSLFGELGRYARKSRESVAITLGENNLAFGEPVDGNDNIHKAVFKHVNSKDEYTLVRVYPSNTQRLDKENIYGEVPYYMFSHEVNDKEYFLNADRDSVRWVYFPGAADTLIKSERVLDDPTKVEKPDPYAMYKFALPKVNENDVYLQALDTTISGKPRVIKFKGGGDLELASTLPSEVKDGEGIFSALDFYKEPDAPLSILAWKFESATANEWVSIDDSFFDEEDGTAAGVLLAVDFSESSTFIGSTISNGVRYSVLSTRTDPSVMLRLKRVNDSDDVTPTEESQSGLTALADEPTYYHIMQDGLYLTDNGDDRISFVDNATEKSRKFAFTYAGENDGEYLFGIVSVPEDSRGDYRYLSNKALNVVFTDNDDDMLSFRWSKRKYSGIKVINAASAKVYGVSGGVKVANALGAVSVYTVDGRLVTTQAVTSPNRTIAVPAGIYIVRNGAEVAKVVVK